MLIAWGDDLVGARAAALRRGVDARTMDDYVSAHLSRVGAFRGVLGLFQEQYAATLRSVHAGLRADAARAGAIGDGFEVCRRELSAAEDRSSSALTRLVTSLAAEAGVTAVERLGGATGQRVGDLADRFTTPADVARSSADVMSAGDDLASTIGDVGDYRAFADGGSR